MDIRRPPGVVVGVDRSLAGLAALRVAVGEAKRRGVPLYAVRVQTDFIADDFTEIDQAFTEAIGGLPQEVAVYRELLASPIGDALTRRASRPGDLLVIGTSGRGLWHALWSGSVSRRCLRKARCPVLAVPSPEMARSLRRHWWQPAPRDLWRRFEEETLPVLHR